MARSRKKGCAGFSTGILLDRGTPGCCPVAGLAMFQVKLVWALAAPLLARSVTVYGPLAASPALIDPEISPVAVLIDSPAGSPGRRRPGWHRRR